MTDSEGSPIWYELLTTDVDSAQTFYADVVGWSIQPSTMPGTGDYRFLMAPDGGGVGGLAAVPGDAPMEPGWLAYYGVGDVDAAATRIADLGGGILIEPQDIAGVGRFALAADPQGMPFYVMRGDSPQPSRSFDPAAPGHGSWHELATTDQPGALAFYGALFGWTSTESMPMGPMGDYRFVDHAGVRLGAIMRAGDMPPRWTFYFRVPSIADARARIEAGGGTVTNGPHEVPGGDHIIQGADPQGLAFALVGGA